MTDFVAFPLCIFTISLDSCCKFVCESLKKRKIRNIFIPKKAENE